MSVFLRGRVYHYKFRMHGTPHRGTTGLTDRADAIEFEAELKRKLRRRRAGLDVLPEHSPSIQEFAEVYYREAERTLKRPERVEVNLRVVLRFWGERPSGQNTRNPPIAGEPYRNLRLLDPVTSPQCILDFEDWMYARGVAAHTRNQYRSTMSQLYELAASPLYRQQTGVLSNPFKGIHRDRTKGRTVANTIDELRRVLAVASYHVRLALSIGLLAHKLRLANILALRWSQHVDLGRRTLPGGQVVWGWITVHDHKTDAHGAPLVVAISEQLHRILAHAKKRTRSDWVVTYRGRRITSIRDGLRRACRRAGLPYGRFTDDGMTFHTLRHSASTTLAELDVAEQKRKSAAGHRDLSTTQKYTHLRPVHDVPTVETLSAAMPVEDLVTASWTRATEPDGATSVPTATPNPPKRAGIRGTSRTTAGGAKPRSRSVKSRRFA